MNATPVLMYHALEDGQHRAGAKGGGEQLYVLPLNQFRNQMAYLHRHGYAAVLLEDLQVMKKLPERSVVLTFDDGHESNFTLALPVLQEFNFRAEFFVTTGWIGKQHYMTEPQIRGLHGAGMGIGSHGVTHRYFSDLSPQEVIQEASESKRVLEDILCAAVCSFSYPGGRVSPDADELVRRAGFSIRCSSVLGRCPGGASSRPLPRLTITSKTTMTAFAAMLARGPSHSAVVRERVLSLSKKILGNSVYDRLRSSFLG